MTAAFYDSWNAAQQPESGTKNVTCSQELPAMPIKTNKSLMKWSRWVHRWGSIVIALPIGVIFVSGVVLQLKKESTWIQPITQVGSSGELSLSFDQILEISKQVPEAQIKSWADIDRLDVRPQKGMLKVRCKNRWEIQLDSKTGDVLQVSCRRSDLIESIHDGSFFHPAAKLWFFLPAAFLLLGVWATGIYIFIRPYVRNPKNQDRSMMK